MVKNTKAKGRRNEHRSMAIFRKAGYRVHRNGASLGEWDFIAIGPVDAVLVQVKTRDWPGSAEREAFREYQAPGNFRKLLHRWKDHAHLPDEQEP